MKHILLIFLLVSGAVQAGDSTSIISTGGLPQCIQTIDYKQLYPRWKVKNLCSYPVEILWCWKAGPSDWVNGSNRCSQTGFISSGVIENKAEFEFLNRPYINNDFKPAAMLVVDKVCKVTKPGQCE